MPNQKTPTAEIDLETVAEMMAPEPAIMPIDMAEESFALIEYYKQRVMGLRGALRREQEQVKALTERLALAEKGVEEVREEIAKLSGAKAAKAPDKVPYVPVDGRAI